jgi:hypothetical protein
MSRGRAERPVCRRRRGNAEHSAPLIPRGRRAMIRLLPRAYRWQAALEMFLNVGIPATIASRQRARGSLGAATGSQYGVTARQDPVSASG